jgi:hypothetical protein
LRRSAISGRLIAIATHHKTGTVWMDRLWRGIARALGLPFRRLRDHEPLDVAALRAAAPVTVLFQDHARFDPAFRPAPEDGGWHLLRDPRDVLISAANYHGWADEPWLDRPRDNLGGRSYREAILACDFAGAVRFEMGRSGGRAVRDMLEFDRLGGRLVDVRYEDLLADPEGHRAAELFAALGFSGSALDVCLEIWRAVHARGGARLEPDLRSHVQGLAAGQWRHLFDADLLADFARTFPGATGALGYPPDDPRLLVDDPPRRESWLARFEANRGRWREAVARLERAIAVAGPDPLLVRTLRLVGEGGGALGPQLREGGGERRDEIG